jgi:hypothetical protein
VPSRRRRENAPLSTILTVRRHWLPMLARKRAIVIPDIADASIDIREGRPLFPSVRDTADSRQGAVFHSYVGAVSFDRPQRCDIKSSFYAAGRFC